MDNLQSPFTQQYQSPMAVQNMVAAAMKRVYLNMFLGLLVTAFVSMACANSIAYLEFILLNRWAMIGLIIAEFGLVIGISSGINRLSSAVAMLLFFLFAAVNGLMLAPIFLVYTGASIAKTFFITASTFGAMSIYGYTTGTDLSKFSRILFMGLIGLIIATVVNMFMHSESLDYIISFVGIILFVGLTAWDTQKIKQMAVGMPADQIGRLATIGALSLYLDFINLFLYLLRFFGDRRN
ncbi:MAG: Bax inhibitor-1/YccA family protein [Muribaculaceae bacterium]